MTFYIRGTVVPIDVSAFAFGSPRIHFLLKKLQCPFESNIIKVVIRISGEFGVRHTVWSVM